MGEGLKRAFAAAKATREPNPFEGWAPWHPKHGFVDEFTTTTWFSTDLDEVARRVLNMNRDEGTNNRNGWRAVKVTVARVP